MGWYSARLLFKSLVAGEELSDALWEAVIYLIQAESEEGALAKALKLGKDREHEYENEHGQLVSWLFHSVAEVQDLCEEEIGDGAEVFSRLFRREGADADDV